MDADEMALREQIEAHKKRLQKLQVRAALQGINTPPEILIEIEQIQGILENMDRGYEVSKYISPNKNHINNKIKYYIYISDLKVDMFYSQIRQIMRSWYTIETCYERLSKVVSYMERNMDIGTIDKPSSYIKGVFPMRWGLYSNPYTGNKEIVFFGGHNGNNTIGLGGSARHVIGEAEIPSTHSSSATPYLLSFLRNELNLQYDPEENMNLNGNHEGWAFKAIDLAISGLYMEPTQQLEFLAKTLLIRHDNKGYILLGTPLYVALAD